MISQTYDRGQDQNVDWSFSISTNPVVDLTGCTISWQIRDSNNVVVLTLAIGSGITVPTPSAGVANFIMTAAQTMTLQPGTYTHGVTITTPTGAKIAWCYGTFSLRKVRVS